MHEAIIFDFDGVIADSEYLSNQVLADCVTELGVPFTREDSYRQFMGKRFEEVIDAIVKLTGRQLPDNFPENFQERTLSCFRDELRPVSGVGEFLMGSQQPWMNVCPIQNLFERELRMLMRNRFRNTMTNISV